MKVDDYGCFYGDVRLLKANLFPLLIDSIREADLSRWMAECQKAGLIVLYETQGKQYVQIQDFKQRLDRAKSKYPLPVNDCREVVNDYPPEEKRSRKEVEEKDSLTVFTIEHCVVVALNDERWVKANKTNSQELQAFNSHLETQGEYSKNPGDYKRHFSAWKKKNPDKLKTNASNLKKAVDALREDPAPGS